MKWLMEPVAVAFAVIVVVAMIILFGGIYLKTTSPPPPTPEPTTVSVTEISTPITTLPPETIPPVPEPSTPAPTPTLPQTYAVAAPPSKDADKYYHLPYKSTIYNPKGNLPPTIYHQVYEGKFQKEGVDAKVLQAPLTIDFLLTPSQGPTRSRSLLTVRNGETKELLAQEGFYGAYTNNPQKRLYFSAPGTYHVDLYGEFVTVDLTLRAR